MRASDDDRERAVSVLRDHHVAGRLDVTEFIDRMETAQSATYLDELDPLFTDLPAAAQPARPTVASRRAPRTFRAPGRPPVRAVVFVAAAILMTAALVGLSHGHVFVLWLPLVTLWLFAARRRWRRAYGTFRQPAPSERIGHADWRWDDSPWRRHPSSYRGQCF